MYPFLKIGYWHLQSFSLLLVVGALAAVIFATKKFSQQKLPVISVFHIATFAVIFGTIGSRIFYVVEFSEQYRWNIFNFLDGGYNIPGFLLGIIISFLCTIKPIRYLYTVIFIFLSFLLPFFYILAISISIFLFFYNIKKIPIQKLSTWLLAIIFAFLFSRIFYLYWHYQSYNWEIFHFRRGGMTIYGGLLCSLIFSAMYMKKYKIPVKKAFDIVIISVFLALSFGRLGCFLNGCCFGKSCSTPSYLTCKFPSASPVGQYHIHGFNVYYLWNMHTPDAKNYPLFLQELPTKLPKKIAENFFPKVYATQLISALYNIIIFFFLCILMPFKKYDGQIFLLGICIYSMCRFWVEIYRADNPLWSLTNLTSAQNISYVLFCVSLGILLYFTRKDKNNDNK